LSEKLEIVWFGHDLPKLRRVLLASERIPSADIRILHEAMDKSQLVKSRLCDNDPHVFLAVCNENNGAVPLLPPGSWKQLQASKGNVCTNDFKDFNEGNMPGDSHGDSTSFISIVQADFSRNVASTSASETTWPKQD
jgi:hypothetical protein